MAKLMIKRTRHWSGRFVPYSIVINGEKRATIRAGQTQSLELEDGIYHMQVTGRFSASNIDSFEATHGRFFQYEVGSDVDMLLALRSVLLYPALLVVLYFIDRLIDWDYFLLLSLIVLIGFRLVDKFLKKKDTQSQAEQQKYYIYLRQIK